MSETISEQYLSEIETRCAAATPGPWKSYIESRDGMVGSDFISTGAEDIYLTGATRSDQEFIAAARQNIPLLVSEIRNLRALVQNK